MTFMETKIQKKPNLSQNIDIFSDSSKKGQTQIPIQSV